MEGLLKQYEKESMKMAMLKHEETFKEQVYELHRLYRTQKLLMNDIKSRLKAQMICLQPHDGNFKMWNIETETNLCYKNYHYKDKWLPQRTIDLEQPVEECITDDGGDIMVRIEQESDIELTLGQGCNQRKKDETSVGSHFRPCFSSSSTDSDTTQKTGMVETLTDHKWGLIQMHDMNMGFQSERKNAYAVEEQLRQEKLDRPPWLFPVLSLNMT